MFVEEVPRIPDDTDSQIRFAAQKLEQLFIRQLFKSLREVKLFEGYPGSGFESQMFWSMWDDEVAGRAAERESLGLAPVIYRWLKMQVGRAVSTDGPSDAPVSGKSVARGAAGGHPIRISSPFGWRTHPIYGYRHFHTGVDIALPKGYPIRTPEAGVVEFAGPIKGYGNTVIVRIDDGSRLLFAHLDSIEARQGDRIGAGTRIGTAGETGNATGPHLHLELRVDGKPVDPLSVPGLAEAIETVLSQSEKGGG